MRYSSVVATIAGLSLGALLAAQQADSKLTEVQQLRAQLFQTRAAYAQLKAQFDQCQTQALGQALDKERLTLEQEFRALMKPAQDAIFDWQTLTFKAPEKK